MRRRLRRRRGGRRRDGPVFGAEVGDQLSDLLIGEGVAEGRHLLAAVENLMGDFGRGPVFVLAQAGEAGGLLGSLTAGSVTVSAALVAKEDRAGLLAGFVVGAEQGVGRGCGDEDEGQRCDRADETRRIGNHRRHFRISGGDGAQPWDGLREGARMFPRGAGKRGVGCSI